MEYIPPPDFDLPSPPYYRPASSVNLTCRACGATGAVTYKWSSNCTDCLTSTATTQNVTVSVLQANYAGEHTCTAVDSIGNAGSNSTVMNLTGKYHSVLLSLFYKPLCVYIHQVVGCM